MVEHFEGWETTAGLVETNSTLGELELVSKFALAESLALAKGEEEVS